MTMAFTGVIIDGPAKGQTYASVSDRCTYAEPEPLSAIMATHDPTRPIQVKTCVYRYIHTVYQDHDGFWYGVWSHIDFHRWIDGANYAQRVLMYAVFCWMMGLVR